MVDAHHAFETENSRQEREVDEFDHDGKQQQATYDLHQGDPFWAEHMGAAFQAASQSTQSCPEGRDGLPVPGG